MNKKLKTNYKNISIDDFSSEKFTKEIINMRANGSEIKSGYGVNELLLPESLTDRNAFSPVMYLAEGKFSDLCFGITYNLEYQRRRDVGFLRGENDTSYILSISDFPSFVDQMTTVSIKAPFTCCITMRTAGNDVILYANKVDGMSLYDGMNIPKPLLNAKKFTQFCVYRDKFYAFEDGDRMILNYTNELNPENLNAKELVYKELKLGDKRGSLLKLVPCEEYLYVFRDFGITKIINYSSTDDINVSHLHSNESKIYPNSICVAGNKIYMLTDTGLKCLYNDDIKDIETPLNDILIKHYNNNSKSCFSKGKYYIAFHLDFDGDDIMSNNMLAIYDVNENKYEILHLGNILALQPIKTFSVDVVGVLLDGVYSNRISMLDDSGLKYGEKLTKHWMSKSIDLEDSASNKILKNVTFTLTGNIILKIHTDLITKEYLFNANNDEIILNTHLESKNFVFEVISDDSNFILDKLNLKFLVS